MASKDSHATAGREGRIFLIDGPSLLYRAYYAVPGDMATEAGEPTNAIYGFAIMLVRVIGEHGRVRGVVAWDRGTSGRTELYKPYKATRRERPPELSRQWEAAEELAAALGFATVALPGYEADDIIATLAESARRRQPPLAVSILTGDRDVLQLVDEQGLIDVLATTRGVTDTKRYDRSAVIERFGVPPELIPDFYGLKGDSSDNIPGVPGIGEKTAAELLARFGSLEQVLAHADEVSGTKRRQSLKELADQARLSRELARAKRDLPLTLDPGALEPIAPDWERVRELFSAYELNSLPGRLEAALGADKGVDSAAAGAAPARGRPRRRRSQRRPRVREVALAELGEQLGALAEGTLFLAFQVCEPRQGELFADERGGPPLSFAIAGELPAKGAGRRADLLLSGSCAEAAEVIAACAERPLALHDAKSLGAVPERLAHDTMIAAYLIEPSRQRYRLHELCAERELEVAVEEGPERDALLVRALTALQREELERLELSALLEGIELPLVGVLRAIELRGVRIDVALLREIGERTRAEMAELEGRIQALAGEEFLITSPAQLSRILFEKLGLPRRRRGKTGYSTDARVLQSLRGEHEIVPLIERFRELQTLLKTYIDVLPGMVDAESRLHTTFLQTVAQTGRLSSTNPNLQNIPIRRESGREIRACFCAREGWRMIAADYSQIELRVLAHVADEPALKEIFARGEDVHTATAAQVFSVDPEAVDPLMRSKAKMVNYGIVYGLSDYGLADRLNISREEAHEFISAYLERFSQVALFMRQTVERARESGEVRTLWGRRRTLPELASSKHQERSAGERLAVNSIIQGSAADIIKIAMIAAEQALRREALRTRLILTIHDELLFEAPPEEVEQASELVRSAMTSFWEREPALVVDIGVGNNWLEAK
ncbi:MAG TPA: DNA polymerase I [Solirubrobacteraceae bacterium]|nr:DNA polymerase I [Solirubrobacteraceae bacterium]